MIAYKCKRCGSGELESLEDGRKAMCKYCNAVTVLPTLQPEAFNQANELRKQCKFDQAVLAFERIVSEYPNDCESYWNLVLSRYGIEYVKDSGGNYVPTCHRMTYSLIQDDPDYLRALDCADSFSYRHYQEEAQKIDRILKRAAQIAQSQPAYDIFISYKETENKIGKEARTEDSGIAQNIYDALKEKHPELNIFLSRVTLKNVAAGMEYEPVIFSALNTAKLMIVVGTSRENMESTWVQNEWSRFRKMMDRDKNKHMTVVFGKGMNPNEDFPKGLKLFSIQATEASGFYLQDFLRGVEELLDIKEKPVINREHLYQTTSNRQVENLLLRATQALEMENISEAYGFIEKALGIDAQCARAWWMLFNIETNNMTEINEEVSFQLRAEAENDWCMVERYAQGEERAQYLAAHEAYKAKWESAHAERKKRLKKEADHQAVEKAIEEIKEQTLEGKKFNQYARYKIDSEHMKYLLSLADEAQKKWLYDFSEQYTDNYEKYLELQELKKTDPVGKIEGEASYQELEKKVEKSLKKLKRYKQNGVGVWTFLLFLLLTAFTWFSGTESDVVKDIRIALVHALPLVVSMSAVYAILSVLKFGGKEIIGRVCISMVLGIVGYFVVQYLLIKEVRKFYPEVSMANMFLGIVYLILLILVIIFLVLLFKNFIAALVFIPVMFFIETLLGKGIAKLADIIWKDEVFVEFTEEMLEPIKTEYFRILFQVMAVAAVVIFLCYLRNKRIKSKVVATAAIYNSAIEELKKYKEEKLEVYRKPYRGYVAAEYLLEMSKSDI